MQRIINGVLFTRTAERPLTWQACDTTGNNIFLVETEAGWAVRVHTAEETVRRWPAHERVSDAVATLRAAGWTFPPLSPNAVAHRSVLDGEHGWEIVPVMEGETGTFIKARGRTSTVSDLHRRGEVHIPYGTSLHDKIPVILFR